MESFKTHAPRFTSPEQEIAFLRAQIEAKEKELALSGIESQKEDVAKGIVDEYRSLPNEDVLHPQVRLAPEETEALVLRLSPEPHDAVMEELLGVLLDKGVHNALSLVEKMGDPHIEDDFHRFLVQYLVSTGSIPGLKEGSPLFKGLDMKLLEITLPDPGEDEKKSLTELFAAMEQFYAGMHSVGAGSREKNHFTIELAVSNKGRHVVIYAAVPSRKADLFEKQLLGVQPTARITEVTDDYNIFQEGKMHVAASYAMLKEKEVFPIKMYESFDHDPMTLILNAFSKLKEEGEGAAIQFVLAPENDALVSRFHHVLDTVKKGTSVSEALSGGFGKEFLKSGKEFFFGGEKKEEEQPEEPKVDDRAVTYITEKVRSTLMAVNIRIITSSESKERSVQIREELESVFNQFTEAGRNGFEWNDILPLGMKDFIHHFSYRLFSNKQSMPLNLKELATLFHFPYGLGFVPELKQARATSAPAPTELRREGVLLGINTYRGIETQVYMDREDRMRHFYVIGQTGTGKTTILKNMIIQDIHNGEGVCFIDPHGSDIEDILASIPKDRIDDVIYFDPASTARPMGLNMLEYDSAYPEQKTFVVNELLAIFNKLFDMKVAGGPAFEQYFRNSALLVMEHPESGSTLLEIGRVLADKPFRDMKLAHCKNPIIKQFWENAEKTTGEQSLANFVPYITNKFDVFVSNDIMRPVIAQQHSAFNFRDIMDKKKILLVNLSKGRLGEINSSLIGLILVGKILMAALSRVDMQGQKNDFYLYIDEFQNVTTDSIATILSEARKYRLSLTVAHQYIAQLKDEIKNAVFGNVGSLAVFRVGTDDAEYLARQFDPVFSADDIIKLDNFNCYLKMLAGGMPMKPFNIATLPPPKGTPSIAPKIKELSFLKYGRLREEVETDILRRYGAGL